MTKFLSCFCHPSILISRSRLSTVFGNAHGMLQSRCALLWRVSGDCTMQRFARTFTSASTRHKSVIVTGAAQGIGKAIAFQLAQDGYDVCVNDISSKKAALDDVCSIITGTYGRRAHSSTADVTSFQAVEDMIASSVSALGPLNTMVANAGIFKAANLMDQATAEHEQLFAVNYYGLLHCFRAASAQFLAQGPPPADQPQRGVFKLIGASSGAGIRAGPMLGAYSATKFAVRGLIQAFAQELGPAGITCNSYAPGIVGTDMWKQLDEKLAKAWGREKGEAMDDAAGQAVLGRASEPEDVAGAVSWLASPKSDFVTAQTIVVDGGMIWT